MLKLDHKVVIGYTTINVIGVTTVFVKYLISTSTDSDGSIFIRIRLANTICLCPYCNGDVKTKAYYNRKLTHSTFFNRVCYIIY